MKSTSIAASVVIGITLIACALIVRSAIVSYGNSLQRAAQHQRTIDIPRNITLTIDVDPLDLRLGNMGAGQTLRIETKPKEE